MKRRARIAFAAIVVAVAPAIARAHPHGWIDIQSKVVLNENGEVEALQQAWLFDELYSAFMIDELALNGEDLEDGLARLAAEDVQALAEFDYFTRIEVNGVKQALGSVERYANGIAEERLWLRFLLPLAAPVPTTEAIRYAVYDPTYFIELLHVGDNPVLFEGQGSEACSATVDDPEPSAEISSFAASLDRFAVAEGELGMHFAQWIEVTCTSP